MRVGPTMPAPVLGDTPTKWQKVKVRPRLIPYDHSANEIFIALIRYASN